MINKRQKKKSGLNLVIRKNLTLSLKHLFYKMPTNNILKKNDIKFI